MHRLPPRRRHPSRRVRRRLRALPHESQLPRDQGARRRFAAGPDRSAPRRDDRSTTMTSRIRNFPDVPHWIRVAALALASVVIMASVLAGALAPNRAIAQAQPHDSAVLVAAPCDGFRADRRARAHALRDLPRAGRVQGYAPDLRRLPRSRNAGQLDHDAAVARADPAGLRRLPQHRHLHRRALRPRRDRPRDLRLAATTGPPPPASRRGISRPPRPATPATGLRAGPEGRSTIPGLPPVPARAATTGPRRRARPAITCRRPRRATPVTARPGGRRRRSATAA